MEVSAGMHTVTSTEDFGAMVFGYSDTFTNCYMAAAGMCVEDLNLVIQRYSTNYQFIGYT
jgi:hypothetical protein